MSKIEICLAIMQLEWNAWSGSLKLDKVFPTFVLENKQF